MLDIPAPATNRDTEPAVQSGMKTVILACTVVATAAAQPRSVQEDLSDRVAQAIADRHCASAAYAVIQGEQVLATGAVGRSDAAPTQRVDADTRYQIGSVTKVFTGLALAIAEVEGILAPEQPIGEVLDWLPPRFGSLTIDQIAHHVSGLPRDLRRDNLDNMTIDDFKARLLDSEPAREPGVQWEYANTGYILLGLALETACSDALDAIARRMFLDRADANGVGPRLESENRAHGLEQVESEWVRQPVFTAGHAGGGFSASLNDMIRFDLFLSRLFRERPEILGRVTSTIALRDGRPLELTWPGGFKGHYGLGWFVQDSRHGRMIHHGGAVSGFSANYIRLLERNTTVIVLCNSKVGVDNRAHAEVLSETILSALDEQGLLDR